jgi:hypothetical protein
MSFIYYDEAETKTTEKSRLTVLIWLQSSGKTTWCKMKVAQGYDGLVTSPDDVRKKVFAVYFDQKKSVTFGDISVGS